MKRFDVSAADAGVRLDKYLVEKLRGVSRHSVKELIDMGRVKVNGKRVVIAKWEMAEGDTVEVRIYERERRERDTSGPQEKYRGYINVVYEDGDLMVVEKPAGALVQTGSTGGGGPTFVDSLRDYLKRKHKSRGAYVMPVHRLDKETSGLMVFAKSKVGEKLIDQFKGHTVERGYLAVVEGAVDGENGRIDAPIEKGDFGHGRRAGISRTGGGARSLTLYHVKERYDNATFLVLDLKTGRTHQARVHLAHIGHPVVGDKIYGRAGSIGFGRHALHSSLLVFEHPRTGKRMRFSSGLPQDMEKLVNRLRGE